MIANPNCPVCGVSDWEEFAKFHYTPDMNNHQNDYQQSRMKVLFELWSPGIREIDVTGILCKHCGYVTYKPRPSQRDIVAKYEWQRMAFPDVLGVTGNRDGIRLNRKRAEKVFCRLVPFLPAGKIKVLDLGGGDGRLLAPFLREGHECFVVDYNEKPVPGIRHVCHTMEEMPSDLYYDVVICSHILEHQAEPAKLLTTLAPHLSPRGRLYAEVPADLFGTIPIAGDPVTHIGFFGDPGALNVMLEVSGFQILKSRAQIGTFDEKPLHILWTIGELAEKGPLPHFDASVKGARRYLHPHFLMRVARWYHPLYVWGTVRKYFHYHHPLRKWMRRWRRRVNAKILGKGW